MSETTPPHISPEAIRTYTEVVFGYLEGLVPIRAFAEKGTPEQFPVTEFVPIDDAAERLINLAPGAARKHRGLYVVPSTVASPGRARAEDIVQTGILLIDLDHGNIEAKRDHLVRHLGDPSLLIGSGGRTNDGQEKLHVYWRLAEPASGADLARVAALRTDLAGKAGGDPSLGRLHQPIRVPGTIHGKHGRMASVRLIERTSLEYDLMELADAIAAMPALEMREDPGPGIIIGSRRRGAHELATQTIREGGLDGTTRFDALSTVIGHWIRTARNQHCTLAEARRAVIEHNAAMIVPPWPEARLAREFDALLKLDVSNNGPMPQQSAQVTQETNPAPELSEDALAEALVAAHGTHWRHTANWNQWHLWDNQRWALDETRQIRELARQTARVAAQDLKKPVEGRRIASHKTISAIVSIAACDPRIAMRPSDWDTHTMLLNTPAGIVNLETGETMAHDPTLHITQIAGAVPGSGCPHWKRFLEEITDGDCELQSYLKRLCGYALTGDISEQVFAFFHGNGANGKSVLLSTLSAILGDYAATATQTTFLASQHDRHLSELAGLRSARLVTVPETERGRAWAGARIKAVTGGEKIRANFMRQDHFEFAPKFKLIVAGNHRPELGEVGEAMRRRLHLVPFDVTIPPDRRDKDLPGKLMAEADGILGWMIDGCAEWQRHGLAPPSRVRDASDAYIAEEDLVGQWIEQACEVGPAARQAARELFASWSAFARDAGIDPGSQKALGDALRQREFQQVRISGSRGWQGLQLRLRARGAA